MSSIKFYIRNQWTFSLFLFEQTKIQKIVSKKNVNLFRCSWKVGWKPSALDISSLENSFSQRSALHLERCWTISYSPWIPLPTRWLRITIKPNVNEKSFLLKNVSNKKALLNSSNLFLWHGRPDCIAYTPTDIHRSFPFFIIFKYSNVSIIRPCVSHRLRECIYYTMDRSKRKSWHWYSLELNVELKFTFFCFLKLIGIYRRNYSTKLVRYKYIS